MKIVIVHQYYLLPGQPGGSRFNEMARLWAAAGHSVTVIAGTLNYATGEVPKKYHGRWITREQDGPITVWRCHVPQSYGKSYLGRMWAFFVFIFSGMTAALQIREADVVVATSPPLISALPGWLAAWRRRVPWIFEIRDLWPESAVTTGVLRPGSLLTRLLYALEKWACRKADRVNVLTPAFRDDLLRRGLVSPEKVVFIPNGADTDLFQPGERNNRVRREFGWGDRFVAMYAGAHGRANALRQLVDAATHLLHRPDILIACVGDGPERAGLEEEARSRHLTNIQFCGPQPKSRMVEFVNACDVGVAVLQNNPTFRTVYPNKVFDYMACERPVLLAIDGVARQLVCEESHSGVFVEPEDSLALAKALQDLADDRQAGALMGRQGRAWVLANATREALAQRYLQVMADLTESRQR